MVAEVPSDHTVDELRLTGGGFSGYEDEPLGGRPLVMKERVMDGIGDLRQGEEAAFFQLRVARFWDGPAECGGAAGPIGGRRSGIPGGGSVGFELGAAQGDAVVLSAEGRCGMHAT